MSTNNSKRAYEEVSEDDQYFIDRALEIKARVEKYYDNHPEEYKELYSLYYFLTNHLFNSIQRLILVSTYRCSSLHKFVDAYINP